MSGFTTTDKVPIPEVLRKALEKAYLHSILIKIDENDITLSLAFNLDQTSSKYIPVSYSTIAAKRSKHVPIKGSTDKRMVTDTFTITLDGHFLPMHLVYAGKTKKASQESSFLCLFCLASTKSTTAMKKSQLKC